MGNINWLHSKKVKETALSLGFDLCGISVAGKLEKESRELEEWLKKGLHGEMNYMENHFDLRTDPTKLFPGAKSVISLVLNYFPEEKQNEDAPSISKYAYGRDYHKVIRKKLKIFLQKLQEEFGEIQGRGFVDSAPVMDKAWAKKSGLGWVGKHTNLLNRQMGSFFFLAELITDLELEPDAPTKDYCGTCTRCIDACPTDALFEPYKIDAQRCISYLTIELKNEIPVEFHEKMEDWMFGCDICQDVCPWNRFSKPHKTEDFQDKTGKLSINKKEWIELTEDLFNDVFTGSAVKRTGFEGLKRNIQAIGE